MFTFTLRRSFSSEELEEIFKMLKASISSDNEGQSLNIELEEELLISLLNKCSETEIPLDFKYDSYFSI